MSESSKETIGGFVVLMATLTICVTVMSLARAYAVSTVWDWYIVTAFDAPPMSVLTAFGVNALIVLAQGSRKSEDAPKVGMWRMSAIALTEATVALCIVAITVGIAWVGTLFM